MKNPGVFTTSQAAKWCGVSFRTVLRWIERGELQAYKLPGRGDHRIQVDAFVEFLSKHDMPIPEQFNRPASRALIVDDDPASVKLISTILQLEGYEVRVALDGFSAGAQLVAFAPDIVTLDLKMPGLSGNEVIQFVRSMKQFRNTKILVVSSGSIDKLEKAVSEGADDYLAKPLDQDKLREKVSAILGNKGHPKLETKT
ncbi:MAG: response regulator receiver protein [Fibrobacteres bacterium]|nr:response regulator receiver protein [Fibrobacterota bacterium]